MDPALPILLRDALDSLMQGQSGQDLAAWAEAISRHYRVGGGSAETIRTEADALAYALTRMPATYAATVAALSELAERAPGLSPTSVVDLGCGPGTASWAALSVCPDIETLHLIDRNLVLFDLASRLLASTDRRIEPQIADMVGAAIPAADLIIAAYALTELPLASAVTVAERAWAATAGALVIVEPGTPNGWERLMAIRSRLLGLGAAIAAPCPHAMACPVTAPDWCHFSQRLPRLRAHRQIKGADAPYEDEKFAYLVMVRRDVALEPARPRVLAPPLEDKIGVTLKLCRPDGGLERRHIAKRDKEGFRAVRRIGWGDTL